MKWFNYYGLAIMAVIMLPNIVYFVKHKNDAANAYNNKTVTVLEQIGRYACFVLMIFNIPYTYFGFWFDYALAVYLSVNGGLCLAYLIFWAVCWKRNDLLKALSLSILPSCIFLFSGIVLAYIPLVAFAILFAANHILISCKNAQNTKRKKKTTLNDKWASEFAIIFVIILLICAVISLLFGKESI